jgi:hypothetical protein
MLVGSICEVNPCSFTFMTPGLLWESVLGTDCVIIEEWCFLGCYAVWLF